MGVALIEREGAQVKVEDGTGRVVSIEPKGRNAHVTINAEHLREPVKAWADGNNAELAAALRAAAQSGQPIPYRIEVHRKRSVDPTIPLEQVGNRDKVRDLVAVGAAAVAAANADPSPWTTDAAPAPPTAATAAPPDTAAPATAPPDADRPPAAATAPPAAVPGEVDQAQVQRALAELAAAVRNGGEPREVDACKAIAVDVGASAEQVAAAMNPKLTTALRCLRQMTIDGVRADSNPYVEQRQYCIDNGASVAQLRWAQGIVGEPGEASSDNGQQLDAAAAALSRRRDPDKVNERAAAPYNGNGDAPPPPVAARSGLGTAGAAAPRGFADPAPWKARHDTGPLAGQLNLSSYEVSAAVDLVELSQRILIRRARAAATEEGSGEVQAPTREQVQALAGALVLAADRVQVAIRGGSVDRQSGLYRRAVRAVREAIDWYPAPPDGTTPEQLGGWHRAIVDHAATTIRVALALIDEHATYDGQ